MVTQWVVIAALLSCLLGLIDGLKTWRRVLIAESTWTRYALQCAAAIVLLHVGIGEHLLMSFGVYELNPHIVEARVPRYGPGAVWFYGPAQWLFGADHVWLSRLNRFYGLGAIVMTSALALKLFKHHVGIAVVTLMLAACTPVIYLAHTSESIVVGPTFAYLTGLWFALKTDGRSGVLAALALGAAALARPEMAVVVCLTPLWLWWVRRAEHDNERLGHAWSAVAALYTLVLAQAAWLAERLQGMMISGSLDVARDADNPVGLFFWNLGGVSGPLNIVLNPMFTPTVVAIGVLAALVQRSTRQTALSVVGLSVVWMMLTTVDLTFISIPRLQLPSLLLVLPVSAAGLVSLGFLNQPLRRRLLSGLLLLGAGVTVWLNFPTTNAQTEDRFWRSALDALPDEPGCLITLRYEDPPDGGRTTRNTPDYLLTTRDPAWSVSGVLEAERTLERCPGPVYALLGMRCHAQLRNKGEAAPDASELQEGCKLLHERFTLEPVLESWVENAGDLDYPMYPRGGPLRLGLYRVLGLR